MEIHIFYIYSQGGIVESTINKFIKEGGIVDLFNFSNFFRFAKGVENYTL